jgi:hypothetical protein
MNIQRFSLGVAVGVFACVLGSSVPMSAQTQGQTQGTSRKLDISFNNGLVTIVAENVTLREILVEWGRKGGSRIVNAEKLTGQPLPYREFRDQPEIVVLRSLLRELPGYGAAPRVAPSADASTIEAVFLLAARAVPVSNAPAYSPMQQYQQPQPQPQPTNQRQILPPQDYQISGPPNPSPRVIGGSPDDQIPPAMPIQGDLPPSVQPSPANPNLRVGPGGMVTSTVPGVVIGAQPPTAGGRGGRGGGGSLR